MATQYLICFAFEDPDEFRTNAERGTDWLSGRNIWIAGDSEAAALKWGEAIAQHYVTWLFSRAEQQGYIWDPARFACWLESDPTTLTNARTLDIPTVSVGDMPDLEELERNG